MARYMGKGSVARRARHDEAATRQKERDKRSPNQQIAVLDRRLGAGQGAKKERARLQVKIATAA